MAKNRVSAIELQSIDAALFGGFSELTPLGGLPAPCFYIRILNNSNKAIYVSYDGGTTNNDIVLAGRDLILEFQNQSQPNSFVCLFPQGFRVYVDSIDGLTGSGDVYLSAYYQEG